MDVVFDLATRRHYVSLSIMFVFFFKWNDITLTSLKNRE